VTALSESYAATLTPCRQGRIWGWQRVRRGRCGEPRGSLLWLWPEI